jgi:hypothetical protein
MVGVGVPAWRNRPCCLNNRRASSATICWRANTALDRAALSFGEPSAKLASNSRPRRHTGAPCDRSPFPLRRALSYTRRRLVRRLVDILAQNGSSGAYNVPRIGISASLP